MAKKEDDLYNLEDHLLQAKLIRISNWTDINGGRIKYPTELQEANALLIEAHGNALAVIDAGNTSPSNYERLFEARDALIAAFRLVVNNYLRHNSLVTNQDLVDAGLPILKTTRNRKPQPKTHPEGEFTNIEPGCLKGRFHDEDSSSISIPASADALELSIECVNNAEQHIYWNQTFHSARPLFYLPVAFCNRKLRAKARWMCDNGGEGPWCDPFDVVAVKLEAMDQDDVQKEAPPQP